MSEKLKKVEWLHFRVMSSHQVAEPKGGVTVCYLPIEDKAVVGTAVCSLKDTYCKKIGRKASEGRAKVRTPVGFISLLDREGLVKVATQLAVDAFQATNNWKKMNQKGFALSLYSHKQK